MAFENCREFNCRDILNMNNYAGNIVSACMYMYIGILYIKFYFTTMYK